MYDTIVDTVITNIVGQLRQLIGVPPSGYEVVEYIFSGVLLIFIFSCAYSLIGGIINSIFGR